MTSAFCILWNPTLGVGRPLTNPVNQQRRGFVVEKSRRELRKKRRPSSWYSGSRRLELYLRAGGCSEGLLFYSDRCVLCTKCEHGYVLAYQIDTRAVWQGLIRVNDPRENATWIYSYDCGGNIRIPTMRQMRSMQCGSSMMRKAKWHRWNSTVRYTATFAIFSDIVGMLDNSGSLMVEYK